MNTTECVPSDGCKMTIPVSRTSPKLISTSIKEKKETVELLYFLLLCFLIYIYE